MTSLVVIPLIWVVAALVAASRRWRSRRGHEVDALLRSIGAVEWARPVALEVRPSQVRRRTSIRGWLGVGGTVVLALGLVTHERPLLALGGLAVNLAIVHLWLGHVLQQAAPRPSHGIRRGAGSWG